MRDRRDTEISILRKWSRLEYSAASLRYSDPGCDCIIPMGLTKETEAGDCVECQSHNKTKTAQGKNGDLCLVWRTTWQIFDDGACVSNRCGRRLINHSSMFALCTTLHASFCTASMLHGLQPSQTFRFRHLREVGNSDYALK